MAVFQLGSIIKKRREELGYSQEELADGICSVPTLSRIENGDRMPTKDHFEMLMQRLGYSAMSLDFFTDKRDFLIHEQKFKIRQSYINKDYPRAKAYMSEYLKLLGKGTPIDQQFSILYSTLLDGEQYSNSEKLERFESALLLTCPRYSCNKIPRVLTYEEIILLNNIAICYDSMGHRENTISILNAVKEYYEHHIISTEEALRTQPLILYNLSKFLGLNGQYDECIEVCNLATRIACSTGRCTFLGKIWYNRGWALLKRGQDGDYDAAQHSIRQAYLFASALEYSAEVEHCKKFWEKNFPNSKLL